MASHERIVRLSIVLCVVLGLSMVFSAGSPGWVASVSHALQGVGTVSPVAGTLATPDTAAQSLVPAASLADQAKSTLEEALAPNFDLPESIAITFLAAAMPSRVPRGAVTLSLERVA